MHQRLPTVRPPMVIGLNSGERSSEKRRSVPSRAFSASSSATDLYLKKCAMDWPRRIAAKKHKRHKKKQSFECSYFCAFCAFLRLLLLFFILRKRFSEQGDEPDQGHDVADERDRPHTRPVGDAGRAVRLDDLAGEVVPENHGRAAGEA